MIAYHYVEQGSKQWKIDRVGKYTGSNAEKLLGSFGASEYAKAIEDSFRGNFWTKRGHALEDEAIEIYEAITKTKILRNEDGLKVGYITNSKYLNCLYSPDGLPPIPILEVKCFDIEKHLQLIHAKTEDDIPLKIRAQCHYGTLIGERPYAHLVPYNPSKELAVKDQFRIITIKANKNIQNNFKRILTERVTV